MREPKINDVSFRHGYLVSVTGYRHPVIISRHLESMQQAMRDVCFGLA